MAQVGRGRDSGSRTGEEYVQQDRFIIVITGDLVFKS